ncbi:nuclear transport factor 2 family protein [bacterium]|nr:nuclear transport factor 2 family protein [bacterium]
MGDEANREIEDRVALRHLVEQYAMAADRRDAALFADVFAEDGVLITPKGEVRGRAELLAIPEQLDVFESTRHRVDDHSVVFPGSDGVRATGEVECVAEHRSVSGGRERVYVMYIRYHDEYVRDGSGWHIVSRRLDLLRDEHR